MSKIKALFPVILAGGSGTRFWPLSRQAKPKQFLNIVGSNSLLQETIVRILPVAYSKNILIVSNVRFKKLIMNQARMFNIPSSNLLFEPEGKNTAPAICWAAQRIHHVNPNAVMAVLPSDHLIQNRNGYLVKMRQAIRLAQKGYLMTLGITPTRPETGYGYLKTKKHGSILFVEKFTEKPSPAKAAEFLRKKNYLWNGGMFIWRTSVILQEFERLLPQVYSLFQKGTGPSAIKKIWKKLPNISVDYGILEKSEKVAAVSGGKIGWSDIGSWESLLEITSKDKKGNIFKGDVLSINCRNNLIKTDKRCVAAIGLENLIVIDTKEALLICRKDQSQKVKELVMQLKRKNRRLI